jgi:hypothetical protein
MKKNRVISLMFITLLTHSLCCVLPVICFFIGFISAGQYFDSFHKYETVLVVINIVAIAYGFYMYYLHDLSACDHKHCHTNKTPFWIVTIISLLMIILK